MVEDGAFSHKIDCVTIFKEILNLEGHPNCITGSTVIAILLNGWILPIGRASAVKGLRLQPAQQACFIHCPSWRRYYLLMASQLAVQCTMYLTLHSFSPKLCSATIDLKHITVFCLVHC